MSSPYDLFQTNEEHERKGVTLDYGDFAITVARAGGSNRAYSKALEQKTKPLRRAIASGHVDAKRMQAIMREVFAETVVLGWENVTDKDGEEIPFNKENCVKLFADLPELFNDVMTQASNFQLFQDVEAENEEGN